MLTESFIAATQAVNKQSAHTIGALKDVGVYQYEYQPQSVFRHGFKKSSVKCHCLATSEFHVFAAQSDKATIHVYNREKGNHEATVPFPERIHSLVYADTAAVLIVGTEDGKLVLWELATGRLSSSSVSHLQPVSQLVLTKSQNQVISGSSDSSIHVWSTVSLLNSQQSEASYNDSSQSKAPTLTYANHRAPITALAVSNSSTNINFVVSVSEDLTSYIWHLATGQTLRTLLLPNTALCASLDPVDRAVYFGCNNGSIYHVELFGQSSKDSQISIFNETNEAPIQLRDDQVWRSSSNDTQELQCMTLSYDGTSMVSGHASGAILRWDVAKHRVVSELVNVGQPVTNITMLPPVGLLHEAPGIRIPNIVKPKLELNDEASQGTVGLAPVYNLHIQIRDCQITSGTDLDDVYSALNGSGLSDQLLDDAVQAMLVKPAGVSDLRMANREDRSAQYKLEALQEELETEKRKVAWFQEEFEEARKKHERRQQTRDKLMAKKIGVYRSAVQGGVDGEAAIQIYHAAQEMVDRDSDEDVLSRKRLAES